MLDQLRLPRPNLSWPLAGKNASLEKPLDTTEPELAGGPGGVGEGAGLDLHPPG